MNPTVNPEERARAVQDMFGRIAPRYDLMNRLMTGGMDVRLRKIVIRKTDLPSDGHLLDLGAGTGDLAAEAVRQYPQAHITAADFTLGMMQAGQKRPGPKLDFSAADALHIPFESNVFDAVVSGFLLRNVVDLDQALRDQWRVLKPGGVFVSLDTTKPKKSLLSPFINFHMHRVIPFLGNLLTGDRDAYVYLPETTENFLSAEALAEHLTAAGFEQVNFKRYMFNTVAIHWAIKPA
ncbi:MAG: ubiquinone biosynthesis protein UbiE [Anaerolineaceae bacterium]|nr:ubiquinone biosynthesis protein UbiE [Anaerolineaceae bacterium]